ncbi:GNAT family N-acetyltransferase [Nocardioides sp.]|uniref:GNAT family N-acetyltransferase n=1 Tax=Nocardioides sp. TaxID=35761 RepID=UPI0039E71951
MSRSPVTLREAVVGDAGFLAGVWQESLRRADRSEQIADLEVVIKTAAASPEERLLIAEYAGEPAGAVYLRISPLTPLNPEPTLQALHPHVVPSLRRKGVGRALMDAAVTFAEDHGLSHIATAAPSGSRDANRFLARLAMGPQSVLRVAATHAVRAKLNAQFTAQLPPSRRLGYRPQRVLAARRSMRRTQAL